MWSSPSLDPSAGAETISSFMKGLCQYLWVSQTRRYGLFIEKVEAKVGTKGNKYWGGEKHVNHLENEADEEIGYHDL